LITCGNSSSHSGAAAALGIFSCLPPVRRLSAVATGGELPTPGEVYEYTIGLESTCNVFAAGDRIRPEIRSSDFPRFDRDPDTSHDPFADSENRPALQPVMHRAGAASCLILPVIPAPC